LQNLVPRRRIEDFLKELANTHLDAKVGVRLKRRFPEFLDYSEAKCHPMDADDFGWAPWIEPLRSALGIKGPLVSALAAGVRSVWADPDARSREWKLFLLRLSLADALEVEDITDPPPLTPLERALSYLQREGRRAKRCANQDCAEPYFFARRKNQKFCCAECAAPAKLEAKRRWWAEHGGKPRKRG